MKTSYVDEGMVSDTFDGFYPNDANSIHEIINSYYIATPQPAH